MKDVGGCKRVQSHEELTEVQMGVLTVTFFLWEHFFSLEN